MFTLYYFYIILKSQTYFVYLILSNTKIRYVFTNQLKPIILVTVFSLHLNIPQIAHYCHYDYIRVNDSLISPPPGVTPLLVIVSLSSLFPFGFDFLPTEF